MRARKTESPLRRQQIVHAALELIGTHGVHALSIAAIAQRVGIVPSALYRHFESKEEVLDAILEALETRLMQNVGRVRKDAEDALSRLHSLLRHHARMLKENRALPHVVFSDAVYTGRPERKARLAAIIMNYLQEIEEIIHEGQHEGCIRRDVPAATAAVMFLGLIFPAAVLGTITEGRFDMIAHAENAWPAFVRSIATET